MSPPRALRLRLAAARAEGLAFAAAWPGAFECALHDARPYERDDWSAALAGTVDTWQRAFEHRESTRVEEALSIVNEREGTQTLACERCGGPIPARRTRQGSRWCSADCARKAKDAEKNARKAEARRLQRAAERIAA